MQIDPQAMEYGDIVSLEGDQREAEQALFEKAVAEGKIVARSHDAETLKMLQDDLRKAGYRRQR